MNVQALLIPVFFVAFAAAAAAVYFGRQWLRRRRPEPGLPAKVAEEAGQESIDWLTPLDNSFLLKEETLSSISLLDRLLARVNGVEILKAHIAQAGLRWSVGRVFLAILLGGAATWAILHRMSWLPEYGAVAAGALAACGPYLVIQRRRRARLLQFEEQFPDAMDSLSRALRAGNSLAGALMLLARESKEPLAPEIRKTVDERNLGVNWDQALGGLAVRVPIQEVSMFVAAVQLHSRTGGRLNEVLALLAENMRESSALKGEIRAIAAHGKMTGMLLTILPVVIAVLMTYFNPAHMAVLWTHPAGKSLVLGAVGCLVAAHFVIRKLVDIRI